MLEKRDLILAFALHILVVVLIVVINQWKTERKPMPERLIQVNMVSLQELKDMMAKPKPAVKPKAKKKTKVKPKPKPKKKSKPKPVITPKKPKKVKQKVIEEDPDYDPFAPLESKPKKIKAKKVSGKKVLHDLLKGQLSDQEVNKYIAGMQKSVSQQWKVPVDALGDIKSPLVELILAPNGNVVRIKILETSGSAMLDETLKKAIYAAAPFKVPSKQFELFRSNMIRFYPL
ncbi:MAG: TonB C-terminal domain-containing protein [Ghiorsea sp.]